VKSVKNPIQLGLFLIAIGIVLIKVDIIDLLVVFLLVGGVPGTNYSLPSTIMLIASITVIWLVILRFVIPKFLPAQPEDASTEHKKRLPRRRFNQI